MLPGKKAQTFLLIVLVIFIVGLVGANLFLSYGKTVSSNVLKRKINTLISSESSPIQRLVELASPEKPPLFQSPVEKDYLKEMKLVQLDLGKNDLGFALPEGAEFKAGFDGLIEITGEYPQQVINLYSKDGGKRLLYLFAGTSAVENRASVRVGAVLGRAGKDFLPTREVNLIVRYFEGANQVSLKKGLIKVVE